MSKAYNTKYLSVFKRIIIIVGGFGSGKTEISINLAKILIASEKTPLTVVDLDLVNPYFRTREAVEEMQQLGIRPIIPKAGQFYADLPILLPEIKGAIQVDSGRIILDVGGDAQGSRALGSLADLFTDGDYEMLMVLNSRRPMTSDVDGCRKTMSRIEKAARLKFTGLISNSHMIEDTDQDVVLEGYELARSVSQVSSVPLKFISAKTGVLDAMNTSVFDCGLLPLTRSLLKPWEKN